MSWIFLGVIVGSTAYLAQILLNFMERYRGARSKIEQSVIDLRRIENQLDESEHARMEAESRASGLEEEAVLNEHQISELQEKINSRLPKPKSA